jgi:glycosyltransferase involved in cell wall biosynthesis
MAGKPRVAFIQPRLDGHGGLEKFGVYVIQQLAEKVPVDVISEHEVDLSRVERAFGVRLDQPRFLCDPRCNPVMPPGGSLAARAQWKKRRDGYRELTAGYDLVIGQTVGLPFRSGARRSVLLCHFPVVRRQKVDPSIPHTGLASLLSAAGREQRDIRSRLDSWSHVVSNSDYTRRWVRNYWHRDSSLLFPPIELPDAPDMSAKTNWIIGVAYFSPGEPGENMGHKRQEILIDTFRALCDEGLRDWELHLAGHVLPPTPEAHAYVDGLRRRAEGYPIHLHTDCPHAELMDIYRRGSIFWHATGYGVDAEARPERCEPFGMVTVEAMGWGCVPVVINRGGQPEIVQHERSGYLWDTVEQLKDWTLRLIRQPELRVGLAHRAVERAQDFGLPRFRKEVDRLLDAELEKAAAAR